MMYKALMKMQWLLACVIILNGCAERATSQEHKSYSSDACRIQEVRDSTINQGLSVVGVRFICDDTFEVRQINFLEENPWRDVDFPILPFENPYLKYSNTEHYESSYRSGFIPFDISGSGYADIERKFNISMKVPPGEWDPAFVHTVCRYKLYNPHCLILYYGVHVYGALDTVVPDWIKVLHAEGKMKIYSTNGKELYKHISKEYALYQFELDSTQQFLFLRTWKPDLNAGIIGIEIRNIPGDSAWVSFEMDSMLAVSGPEVFGQYAVYEVSKQYPNSQNDWDPYQLLVFDIGTKKLLRKTIELDFEPRFNGISGHSLIFMKGGYESELEETYDTIPILNLEILVIPKRGSKYR